MKITISNTEWKNWKTADYQLGKIEDINDFPIEEKIPQTQEEAEKTLTPKTKLKPKIKQPPQIPLMLNPQKGGYQTGRIDLP